MKRFFAALIFIFAFLGSSFARQAPAAAQGQGAEQALARVIAVFPYGAREGALRPEHAFAAYAVPDMLRVNIAARGRFLLCEKFAVEEAYKKLSAAAGESGPGMEALRAAAKALGADHFIWGYLISTGSDLGLYQELVETETGATRHMVFSRLPSNSMIFDEAEASAREFAAAIDARLEVRPPDIVYVEKEVIVEREVPVERVVEIQAPASVEPRLTVAGNLSCRFFYLAFGQWLRPALRAGIEISGKETAKGFGLGFLLESSPLIQKTGVAFVANGITVLQTSALVQAAWKLRLSPAFIARIGVSAGASIFAGYVSPQVVAYIRPEAGLRSEIQWNPTKFFGMDLGARAGLVMAAWDGNQMLDLAPFAGIRFRF